MPTKGEKIMIDIEKQNKLGKVLFSKKKMETRNYSSLDKYFIAKNNRDTSAMLMAYCFIFGTYDIINSSNFSYSMMERMFNFVIGIMMMMLIAYSLDSYVENDRDVNTMEKVLDLEDAEKVKVR